jgi:cold shock CspA family protein
MKTGTIKKILTNPEGQPNFGFITIDGSGENDKDLFFHFSKVLDKSIKVGDAVSFDINAEGAKGPEAIDVRKADAASGEAMGEEMEDMDEDMDAAA